MNNIPPEMQKWVDIFLSNGGIWIYLIVTGIMFFEYIFPPTPGDVVIFSAGFLSGEGGALPDNCLTVRLRRLSHRSDHSLLRWN